MKQLIIFISAILLAGNAPAQMAYIYTSVDSVLVGEPFDVELTFSGISPNDIDSISWDSLNNLEHISLVDSAKYGVDFEMKTGNFKGNDYEYSLDEMEWERDETETPPTFKNTFEWTVWELCFFGIPGPTVFLKNGQSFTLSPKYIYIKDPLMREMKDLAPSETILREQITATDFLKEFGWTILIILAILAALIYSIWWYKNRKKEESELPVVVEKEPEPVIPPHIVAMEKLTALKASRMWENKADKQFVSQLTEIIREYIENRFGVRALEMTTSEITDSLKNEVLENEQLDQLRNTLNVSDMIKFAKAKADSNLYERFVDDAIILVDKTKEKEVEND